ncbi:MAG: hypothetical protein IPK83_06330 [Planctomycetes bacterium]|nr:hypothetical protein [Planctomycetota bacterium]
MSVGTADNLRALMPPNDGAVSRALNDLEEKLNAWNAAAATLSEQLAQKAESNETPPAAPEIRKAAEKPAAIEPEKQIAETSHHEPEPVSLVAPVVIEAAKPLVSQEAEKTPVVASVVDKVKVTAEPPVENDETLLAGLNPERAEAIRARHAFFKGQKTIGELIQEFEDEADDEESLLMSLDPEFAKAVRVKFRLYNGRKTLREVVAEVEASQPRQSQADKKSWWRR